MTIQGIPQGFQSAPLENGPTSRSQRPTQPQPAKSAESKANAAAPAPDSEAQTLSQQLNQLRALSQTQTQVTEISQALQQVREDLASASQERLRELFGVISGKASLWENMNLQEKATVINQLKDKIRSLELERTALVRSLREQVQSGAYQVSGEEILQGMIEEYFA